VGQHRENIAAIEWSGGFTLFATVEEVTSEMAEREIPNRQAHS
jgi:hypothetical protein